MAAAVSLLASARGYVPAGGGFSVLLMLAFAVRSPERWLWWLAAALLIVAVTTPLLVNVAGTALRPWLFLVTPGLLVANAFGLLLFLQTSSGRQLLMLGVGALAALYWENLRRYFWERERYQLVQLETTSLACQVAVVWLAAAFLFRLLLDPTVLPLSFTDNVLSLATAGLLLTVFLLGYRAVWTGRYARERVGLLLIVSALLIGEMFWILNFLPLSPDVKAFGLLLVYYLIASLGRAHLDGTLSRQLLRRYAYLTAGVLFLVLGSAQWLV